jgi:hypothetical protein
MIDKGFSRFDSGGQANVNGDLCKLLTLALALCCAFPAAAQRHFSPVPAPAARLHAPSTMPVHPAVVRIFAAERGSHSLGSGTLIDVRDSYGLVVTNWHVIRDATGEISVAFPDGFQSAARVVKTDPDWDLAALSIWRPNVAPVAISNVLPQRRELLTIAGYGSDGTFRAVSGPCTQYLAPSDRHPHEIVELAATARQGDSGGPILNQRGELAGVLFGSVDNTTAGSYGGRVLEFLAPLLKEDSSVAPPATSGPDQLVSANPALATDAFAPQSLDAQLRSGADASAPSRTIAPLETVPADVSEADFGPRIVHSPPGEPPFGLAEMHPAPPARSPGLGQALLGDTPVEQAKAALAAIGLMSLVFLAFRMGKSAPPAA